MQIMNSLKRFNGLGKHARRAQIVEGGVILGKNILIAGESWQSTTIHTKGFDSFITSHYFEGVKWLQDALTEGGHAVHFMQNHIAPTQVPFTLEELMKYDVVMLSDIGSNTLLLSQDTFLSSKPVPNRCDLLRDYVLAGGGLCMVGGYMTFTGIDAKGRWGSTAVQQVLPVDLLPTDDRCENPQGIVPVVTDASHPVMAGMPEVWPAMLGYNKSLPNGQTGKVLMTIGGDPFVAVGEFGKGRSAVFSSDCSPHWAPPEFCNWEYYGVFWRNLAGWLAKLS